MALYYRRIPIPNPGRWWKSQPSIRNITLGKAIHGIYGEAAPKGIEKRIQTLDDGSQWHELFGYRVRQTSAFFMSGNMLSLMLVNLVVIAILTLTLYLCCGTV